MTKKRWMSVLATGLLAVMIHGAAHAQAPALKDESVDDYNKRMAWFAEAKYGMFIHFGLYSQLGGVWQGKAVGG
ncbi:MAG TPA: alpha-L-fucosidase, partial [Luteolibacter sp.]|nr:alpha-L-fucosidase [Luteolibacter sp.]